MKKSELRQIIREEIRRLTENNLSRNSRYHMGKTEKFNFSDYNTKQHVHSKPFGLWYAYGSDWRNWVRSNMPEWETDNIFEITPNYSKMVVIDSDKKAKEFADKYAAGIFDINWIAVSKDYDGIEWDGVSSVGRLFDMWDIKSGCIWNKRAIKRVELI